MCEVFFLSRRFWDHLALLLLFRIENLNDNHNLKSISSTCRSKVGLESFDNHFAHKFSTFRIDEIFWGVVVFFFHVLFMSWWVVEEKSWESRHSCPRYCKTFVYCTSWLCLHDGQLSFSTGLDCRRGLELYCTDAWNDTCKDSLSA